MPPATSTSSMLSRLEESEPVRLTSGAMASMSGSSGVAKLAGAGLGPVAVAGDGVDLAVVGEQAKGLGQRPARHGVGGEALVEDADRAFQFRIGQVGKEAGQVGGHHQPLVDHHALAEAGDVEVGINGQPFFDLAPGDEQPGGEVLPSQARGS